MSNHSYGLLKQNIKQYWNVHNEEAHEMPVGFPGPLSRLFGVTDAATLVESSMALRIAAAGIFVQIAVGILTSFYQVTQKPLVASIISFTRAGVLQPFLPLLLTFAIGVMGVYISLVLMEVGGLLAAFVGVALYHMKDREAKGFLLLRPVEEGSSSIPLKMMLRISQVQWMGSWTSARQTDWTKREAT
jgi:hypothetical protein